MPDHNITTGTTLSCIEMVEKNSSKEMTVLYKRFVTGKTVGGRKVGDMGISIILTLVNFTLRGKRGKNHE